MRVNNYIERDEKKVDSTIWPPYIEGVRQEEPMIRIRAGYYQDIYSGQVFAVAKRGSRWECQWERGGSWIAGFKSKTKAADHARYMIAMRQRDEKTAKRGYQTLDPAEPL
jgi:hypothetical protein